MGEIFVDFSGKNRSNNPLVDCDEFGIIDGCIVILNRYYRIAMK